MNDQPILIWRKLVCLIGLGEAIVYCQLRYQLCEPKMGVVRDGRKWIHYTLEEMRQDQFPWLSIKQLSHIIDTLEKMCLISSDRKVGENGYSGGTYYALNEAGETLITEERYEDFIALAPKNSFRAERIKRALSQGSNRNKLPVVSEVSSGSTGSNFRSLTSETAPQTTSESTSNTPSSPPRDEAKAATPYTEILNAWSELNPTLVRPRLMKTDTQRLRKLDKFWERMEDIEAVREVFGLVAASDFLSGRKTAWRCDLFWVIEPRHIADILDGKYENVAAPRFSR